MFPRPSIVRSVRAIQSSFRQASSTVPRTQARHAVPSAQLALRSTQNISASKITRSIHLSSANGKGISPESSDPRPTAHPGTEHVAEPAHITIDEYHELADIYIDDLVSKLEQIQEEREDVDCDYSVRLRGSPHMN